LLPLFTALGWAVPRFAHIIAIPTDLVLSVAQLYMVALVLVPVTYIAAAIAAGFPLIDDTLARLDIVLFGFDWDAAARWVAARPAFEWALSIAYSSLPVQAMMLLVIGSLLRPGERNSEFIWIVIFSLSITISISIFTPALGKVGQVGTGYLEILEEIRSGTWRVFTYERAEGIVTFPSFHTTLAVVFTYIAARLHRCALAVFAPFNALMLVSIPPIGGHYVIDLCGGTAVAVFSIFMVRLVRQRGSSAPEVDGRQSVSGAAIR
jgi:hypothetical protein